MSVPSSWRVLRVTVTNSDGPHAPNPTKRTHATLTAPSQREGQGFESPLHHPETTDQLRTTPAELSARQRSTMDTSDKWFTLDNRRGPI
jgi:hypothetical protein